MNGQLIRTAEDFEAFVNSTSTPLGGAVCRLQGEARELDSKGHSFDLLLPMTGDDQTRMMHGHTGANFGRVKIYSPVPLDLEESRRFASHRVTKVAGVLKYSVPFDLQIDLEGRKAVQSGPGRVAEWERSQLERFHRQTSDCRPRVRDDDALRQVLAEGKAIVWVGRSDVRAFDDFLQGPLERFRDQIKTSDATMQGPRSLPGIIHALAAADPRRDALVVVSRGGGSPAALATFHDASLLEAVARCGVPVASAIGHTRDEFALDKIVEYSAQTPNGLGKKIAGALSSPSAPSGTATAAISSLEAEVLDLQSQVDTLTSKDIDLQGRIERLGGERDALESDLASARTRYAHAAAARRIIDEHRVAGALLAILGLPLLFFIAQTGWARSLVGEGGLVLGIFLAATAAAALFFGTPRCIDRPTLTAPAPPQDLQKAYERAHMVWRFNGIAGYHFGRTPFLQRARRAKKTLHGKRPE